MDACFRNEVEAFLHVQNELAPTAKSATGALRKELESENMAQDLEVLKKITPYGILRREEAH